MHHVAVISGHVTVERVVAPARYDDRFLRALSLAAATLVAVGVTLTTWRLYPPQDLRIIHGGGQLALHGHLNVYALVPNAQVGPLTLLVTGLLSRAVLMAVILALLPVALWAASSGRDLAAGGRWVRLLVGGVLLALPWSSFAVNGHVDEPLVIVGALGVVVGHERRSDWLVAASFLVAIAAKPTAVLLLPLVLLHSRRAFAWSVFGAAVVWLPFVLADPRGFFAAGGGAGLVRAWTPEALLGYPVDSWFPWWVRPVQLLGGMALAWWLGRHRSFVAAVMAAFALRAFLEPGGWAYYSGTALAAAVMLEVRWPRVRFLLVGAAALSYLMHLGYATTMGPVQGLTRMACLLLLIVAAGVDMTKRPATRRG